MPTQAPYNQSIAIDTSTGDIIVGIYTSDGFEDSPAEKYTIFFDIDNSVTTSSYCVSTSFGHTGNLEWNYYTFSLVDLKAYFQNPYGTFKTKIRSDNDTDNSFSELTAEMSITIPNQEPFISDENWSQPTSICNDTSTTTTTSSTTSSIPDTTSSSTSSTTTSSSTTSSTTTSSTTTLPPPPPPPPTTTTTLYVVVNDDGSTSEYTENEVKDGTVERDNERKQNEELYGCYMTNAQIERGDCDIPEEVKEEKEPEEETIIIVDEEQDTEKELPDNDVMVPEVENKDDDKGTDLEFPDEDIPIEEQIENDIAELEEELKIEIEIIEIPEDIEIIIEDNEEDIIDENIVDEEVNDDKEIEKDTEEVLVEPIQENVEEEYIELTEEEIAVEVKEVEQVIEEIIIEIDQELTEEETEKIIDEYVEELETEEAVEIIEQVNDAGLENLTEVSEDVIEVVAKVVEEVIEIAQEETLTEEQVEIVAEVLQVDNKDDVQVIANNAKDDEVIAEAVEEYVERAVENSAEALQPYTFADVVVEIQFEKLRTEGITAIIDTDLSKINISEIGSDLTDDQREKAQEVVVPTILARIASVATMAMRRLN